MTGGKFAAASFGALALLLFGCGGRSIDTAIACPDAEGWRTLVASHLARYPGMQPADALKLLQQATLGSEHAVPDSASVAAWMHREWIAMGDGPEEPVIDTLGVGGFARVHLRPWRTAGGEPEALTAAFIRTAGRPGDSGALDCAVDAVAALDDAPWTPEQWQEVVDDWEASERPAMHHSPAFEAAHRPAYRVVALDLVPPVSTTGPAPE